MFKEDTVDSAPLAPQSSLTWCDVGYSVTQTANKISTEKHILRNMTGEVRAGQVVAILGGSGAGKTSLLNTLAGRLADEGVIKGNILVNGSERVPATWNITCAYVEQDDLMYTNLTVYETIRYAAILRLPSSISLQDKLKRVDDIILQLGLANCRDSRIGNASSRGISGGERKRVSIGIELVTDPSILFLDEPTSGLDAFNALKIITTIKELAVKQGKVVLMTIHQPRTGKNDRPEDVVQVLYKYYCR